MRGLAGKPGAVRSLRVLLAMVCVLLVVFAGVVQAAHSHLGCADTHANCSLCAAAHVTVHFTEAQTPAVTASVVARVEALPASELPNRLSAFPHFTRPPPALNLPL
jgi:hypothetical protein